MPTSRPSSASASAACALTAFSSSTSSSSSSSESSAEEDFSYILYGTVLGDHSLESGDTACVAFCLKASCNLCACGKSTRCCSSISLTVSSMLSLEEADSALGAGSGA
eukprot:CAMPEP_0115089286 /NCGR_PEP_ID=MMETSP0227-20121206/24574_1 /TAXON_ID=89957 /ORGANISM="Polarella glacialis, Strain CCMP 1383" /LENGTH=107 /DNA_ID=CAMNT_0002479873 /DNA_START=144 /DNA_END=467 /DNA_ORIENTATION=+